MTLLKKYGFLALALMFFAMSCSKENISTSGMEVEDPPAVEVNEVDVVESGTLELLDGSIYLECYSLVFPTEVVLVDGSIITVENHEELCDLIYDEQLDGYTFPLTVSDSEGNEIVFENQEEVDAAIEDCPEDPIDEWAESFNLLNMLVGSQIFEDCYAVNYPVVIVLEGETTLTANSNEELDNAIFENQNIIGMELPVSVTMVADGSVVELNSVEEYNVMFNTCF